MCMFFFYPCDWFGAAVFFFFLFVFLLDLISFRYEFPVIFIVIKTYLIYITYLQNVAEVICSSPNKVHKIFKKKIAGFIFKPTDSLL